MLIKPEMAKLDEGYGQDPWLLQMKEKQAIMKQEEEWFGAAKWAKKGTCFAGLAAKKGTFRLEMQAWMQLWSRLYVDF